MISKCLAFCSLVTALSATYLFAAPPVPDFGLMFNEDADMIWAAADPDPKVTAANLEQALEPLKEKPTGAGGVRTLVYSIACGSDMLHYPTTAGSTWGWRPVGESDAAWKDRIAKLAPNAAQLDSVRIVADWCTRNGLLFVPTYRMNDAHFTFKPEENPLTGKFWMENGQKMRLGTSPIAEIDNYKELLDFAHPEVRAYRIAIIREAADRYADVMDGFQLDFMRHPFLFKPDNVAVGMPLVTEMIQQTRAHLDALGAKNGRFYPLMVRVPPTLEHCRKAGLDVPDWITRRLVDVVTPSPSMTMWNELPVDTFVKLAEPAGVKVYPGLFDRAQFAWPMTPEPATGDYAGTVDWAAKADATRGAVINGRAQGAAGFELYNYEVPLDENERKVIAAASAEKPADGVRVYAVTARYHFDHLDLYEPPKQLPIKFKPGKTAEMKLRVGEDLAAADRASPIKAGLRIGLWIDGKPPADLGDVTVKLNGKTIHTGPMAAPAYIAVTGKQVKQSKHVPPPVQGYLQLPIEDLSLVRSGDNAVTLTATGATAATKYTICEAQLGVFPR